MRVHLGRCRRLMVMMPPRHGKSELISRFFPAWLLGVNPDRRIILASYEAESAAQWGRRSRDLLEEWGPAAFGVKVRSDSSAADRWDLAGYEGGMVTAGAGGPITGKGADVAIVDDPVKNSEDASSEVLQEKNWEWYQSTLSTRLHKGGSVVLVMTRWHVADLAGRLLKDADAGGEPWEILRLPALAEEPEEWPTGWKRTVDEPLCPDLIPLPQLLEHKRHDYWWSSLYQQRPYAKGGGIFNVEVLKERRVRFRPAAVAVRVRGWDLAATSKRTSKRTSGVLLSRDFEGRWYIEHVVLGKWRPDERNARIRATAERDGRKIPVLYEHEGGSAGEDQALAITKLLAGWRVSGIRVTGDKVTRADQFAAQCNGGAVYLVDDGSWDVEAYLDELESFPAGTYLDQVDSSSLAFNEALKVRLPGSIVPETPKEPVLSLENCHPEDQDGLDKTGIRGLHGIAPKSFDWGDVGGRR